MSLELWLAFVAASAALLAAPGPVVILAISYAADHGRASAWATIPGATLGDFAAMTLSLLGAGAVLAASAALFNALKLAGAAYLLWLGLRLLLTPPQPGFRDGRRSETTHKEMFWSAFTVTALHPGGFVFFVSFVPLFVDPGRPVLPQFIVLEATFLTLAALNVAFWTLVTDRVRENFGGPGVLALLRRLGGVALVAMALATAFSKARNA